MLVVGMHVDEPAAQRPMSIPTRHSFHMIRVVGRIANAIPYTMQRVCTPYRYIGVEGVRVGNALN